MNTLKDFFLDYLYFIIIFAVFFAALFIFIAIINRKDSKKRIYLYGLLMNMKKREIFSLSLIIINFLLLGYNLIRKFTLTPAVILVSILLIIIAFGCIFKAKELLINTGINLVNISLLYLNNLVGKIDSSNTTTLLLQISIMAFGILLYLFTSLVFIRDIRKEKIK